MNSTIKQKNTVTQRENHGICSFGGVSIRLCENVRTGTMLTFVVNVAVVHNKDGAQIFYVLS